MTDQGEAPIWNPFHLSIEGPEFEQLPCAYDFTEDIIGEATDRLVEWKGARDAWEWDAYDLLASWMQTKRLSPALVADPHFSEVINRIERTVRGKDCDLICKLARDSSDPQAWIQEAETVLHFGDEEDAREDAIQLFESLDRCELVAAGLAKLGHRATVLEDQLMECRQWLSSHPEVFLPARRYLVAIATVADPYLEARDPELALTWDKLVVLLDTIEKSETPS